jgi:glycosyltransferase involved in cell wall biosynthesis
MSRGIPEKKITVIPNAVDIEKFSVSDKKNATLLRDLGLENSTVLGFIGSFYTYEGLALLVRSMPEILKQAPDARLLLVGGGPQHEQIVDLVKRMNLEQYILFTGRVPHAEVEEYYSLVDIFVYPRLSMRLTDLVTPLKPLEAMAQGKLVLASDVGGHKELICDGVNGRLFKAGNLDSLVETALDLMRHKTLWGAYRQAGRTYVETERNWSVSVAKYTPVFAGLVGN